MVIRKKMKRKKNSIIQKGQNFNVSTVRKALVADVKDEKEAEVGTSVAASKSVIKHFNFYAAFLSKSNISTRFILDTGCNVENIVDDVTLLKDAEPCNLQVRGLSGSSETTHKGLLPFAGGTVVMPHGVRLLSVRRMLSRVTGSYYIGDADKLTIYTSQGVPLLVAFMDTEGFWSCDYEDLCSAEIKVARALEFKHDKLDKVKERHASVASSNNINVFFTSILLLLKML